MNSKIFISHASEDKEDLARPLATLLQAEGFEVWYDEFQLKHGDSLIESIDRGLLTCDFAIIILSHNFFLKKWTRRELRGLAMREIHSDNKILLPIWHNVTLTDVINFSPPLADKFAINSTIGLEAIIKKIKLALNPRVVIPHTVGGEPFVYQSGHNKYTIKDPLGHFALAQKTNWFYTTEEGITKIRSGGMSCTGTIQNVTSNLGIVEFEKEAGSGVAYTHLSEPLVPFKLYEHSIFFETINSYLDITESVATNLPVKFGTMGNHVFFPEERRPTKVYGSLVHKGKTISIEPFISSDKLYINLVINDVPDGSRLILSWDW
ncbi:MAG TPA: toll/interleukin-1 receptor domain-containing protein [Chitinophagaceae bacterium]